MDLYSLPKDMLVKMISTIREDTAKEYEPYKKVCQKLGVSWCSYPKCEVFSYEGNLVFCEFVGIIDFIILSPILFVLHVAIKKND